MFLLLTVLYKEGGGEGEPRAHRETKKLKTGPPVCVCVCVSVWTRMSQLEKADQLWKPENKVKRAREGWRDGWGKGVEVVKRGGGGRKVLLLLLEKSSGGFVLYLVPWGCFVGGRMALVFARSWCPVFGFGLVALSTSPLLALHVWCVAWWAVLWSKRDRRKIDKL